MGFSECLCIAISAQNSSDSKWEGPLTRCIVVSAVLTLSPDYATNSPAPGYATN